LSGTGQPTPQNTHAPENRCVVVCVRPRRLLPLPLGARCASHPRTSSGEGPGLRVGGGRVSGEGMRGRRGGDESWWPFNGRARAPGRRSRSRPAARRYADSRIWTLLHRVPSVRPARTHAREAGQTAWLLERMGGGPRRGASPRTDRLPQPTAIGGRGSRARAPNRRGYFSFDLPLTFSFVESHRPGAAPHQSQSSRRVPVHCVRCEAEGGRASGARGEARAGGGKTTERKQTRRVLRRKKKVLPPLAA
jgi:hypothetical protein